MRPHSTLGHALLVCLTACGGSPAPTSASAPTDPRPPPAVTAAATADALVESVSGGSEPTRIDEDGRLFVAYASIKHVARALQANEATAGGGDAVEGAGVSILGCGFVAAFYGQPSTTCLDNADELPVPDQVAAMAGEGEGATLGDVAGPLVAWNEARLAEKRSLLEAARTPCALERISTFGESGPSRAEIGRFLSISRTASSWFASVERFHFATLRCGETPLQLLLTEYAPGRASTMSVGSASTPFRVLSWQVAEPADAEALHEIFSRP